MEGRVGGVVSNPYHLSPEVVAYHEAAVALYAVLLHKAEGRLHAARNDVRRVAVRFCDCAVGGAKMRKSEITPDYACNRCDSTGYVKVRPDALVPEELRARLKARAALHPAVPAKPQTCSVCGLKYAGDATCPLEEHHEMRKDA